MKNKNLIAILQKSPIKEDKCYLNLNLSSCKANHTWIYGKSWVWKTYLVTSYAISLIKSSIDHRYEWFRKNREKCNNPNVFIILDPHNSNIPLLRELAKKIIDKNKYYINYSTFFEYSKNWNSNNEGRYFINKKLCFNPLYNPTLNNNLDILEKVINFIISAIKWMIWDFSAFWSRNTPALEQITKWFLLFNIEKNNLWEKEIYSFKDIYLFLDYLMKKKSFPVYINNEFKKLLNSKNDKIKLLWNESFEDFKYLLNNIKENSQFYETLITKLSIFNWWFWETFWFRKWKNEINLELFNLFATEKIEVQTYLFNLEDFSNDEKKAIQSFINAWSYVYWTFRNHLDTKLWYCYIIQDEFQSFLNLKWSKNYLIDNLEKILNEHRKKHIVYVLIFQFIVNELKDLLNNMWIQFIFALPSEQANIFTADLTNWLKTSWLEITDKEITNLWRGSFYTLIDTVNNWLNTIYWESFNLTKEEDIKILLS